MSQTFSERDAWKAHRSREYGSARYEGYPPHGSYVKRLTHRRERRQQFLIEMPEPQPPQDDAPAKAWVDGDYVRA